jgi:Peptidase M15
LADPAFDNHPLITPPTNRWRFAKYAMAVVVPAGMLFAAHRISEPEGLEAAEQPASALEYVTAPDSAAAMRGSVARPPARSFETGAFGHSNAVRVRVALPNDAIRLPIDFAGTTDGMQAQWVGFDGKSAEAGMSFPADRVLRAPSRPGAYWLVISRGGVTDTIADLALFVEHPMPNVMATGINGYHMGRWPKAADGIVPRGFIEVTQRLSDFPLSPHLRLSDFVVHDSQDAFPKYLHVREPLLDKIELIVGEIAQMRGRAASVVKLNVASGFRSPAHNGQLSGSAQDSRHMYGDAADIAIDANNDGKLTEIDARLVAAAAEVVERKYPDLVGGVGLYITTEGAGWPYVHVDVRGKRARWRGGVRRGNTVEVDSLPANATFDSVANAVAAAPGATVSSPLSVKSAVASTSSVSPVPAPALAAPSTAAPSVAASSVGARVAPSVAPKKSASRTVGTRRPARKSATTLSRESAAAHSRQPRPATANSTAPRPSDDPFASAARKFRTSRP